MQIKFKKLHPAAIIPRYQTDGAAGFDLHALEFVRLNSERGVIPVRTGLAVELPKYFELQIRPRSGLAQKGLIIANSPGTIDSDYRGEIVILMRLHHGDRRLQPREYLESYNRYLPYVYDIQPGDRIAQGIVNTIIVPEINEIDELSETERGANGFGSTG